uniref:Uncharacterized protein n=1 Tax=Nephila pilipes TaxID=299642 RepID=A0A8X6NEL5_NEPPI|nr:hypothetical protein NPIL_38391 [Nephila pilipes]
MAFALAAPSGLDCNAICPRWFQIYIFIIPSPPSRIAAQAEVELSCFAGCAGGGRVELFFSCCRVEQEEQAAQAEVELSCFSPAFELSCFSPATVLVFKVQAEQVAVELNCFLSTVELFNSSF